jgi:hypothetical protein
VNLYAVYSAMRIPAHQFGTLHQSLFAVHSNACNSFNRQAKILGSERILCSTRKARQRNVVNTPPFRPIPKAELPPEAVDNGKSQLLYFVDAATDEFREYVIQFFHAALQPVGVSRTEDDVAVEMQRQHSLVADQPFAAAGSLQHILPLTQVLGCGPCTRLVNNFSEGISCWQRHCDRNSGNIVCVTAITPKKFTSSCFRQASIEMNSTGPTTQMPALLTSPYNPSSPV